MINTSEIQKYLTEHLQTINVSESLMQRGVGDLMEDSVYEIMKTKYPHTAPASSKRSIEDFQIGNYKFDIKTHDNDAKFSMPNLISVKRLHKYLSDPQNHLIYIFIKYQRVDATLQVLDIQVIPIQRLDWQCLHIQNLGKGQLQLKNSNNIQVTDDLDRIQWLSRLKDETVLFYNSLIKSIQKEIDSL